MKIIFLPLTLWFLTVTLHAQLLDLNFFIEQATINSPLINKNNNDNKNIELDLKQIKAILSKPEINVEAGVLFAPIISRDGNSSRFEWVSEGAGNYSGYDLAVTDGGQYQAVVALKQPLLAASKQQRYTKQADISRQINENDIALSKHELEQIVSQQYILCIKSKKQSENMSELKNELNTQLLIMQKLVEEGVYKQTDLMLLQIEYQNYNFLYESFLAEYKTNRYDLNLICGISDTNLTDIKDINLELKPDSKSSSQFLKSFKLDSLNIMAEQAIFELKYKPQLNLFANTGLNAVYLPALDRFGFSTGITLSWNIFDGDQREFQKQKSKINLQTNEFNKKYLATQNNINKNKIINQIQSIDKRMIIIEEQLDQYDKLYKVYSRELSQGLLSIMDLKNLIQDIALKKQEKLLLVMEKQTSINSYNYWNY